MRYSALFFFLILIFIGCDKISSFTNQKVINKIPSKENLNYLDIEIDSFLTVELETNDKSFIRFLPEEKNKLWLFNTSTELKRINIADTTVLNSPSLPEKLKGYYFKKNNVMVDPTQSNILWISTIKSGLLKYDSKEKKINPTPIEKCQRLHVFDDWIVCIEKNIILLNKNSFQIDTITAFAGKHLFNLKESKKFGLIVNGHQYIPSEKKLEKITSINNISIPNGINDIIEKDSFIIYSPGRYANQINAIINDKHLDGKIGANKTQRIIEDSTFWTGSPVIRKWNLVNGSAKSFDFHLPVKARKVYVNDKEKYWILTPKNIFSFNRKSESVYVYPSLKRKAKLLQSFVDNKFLYVLYDNLLCIYNKDYLNKKKARFPAFEYSRTRKNYLAFMDSIQLNNCSSIQEYKTRAKLVETKYRNFLKTHPFQEYKKLHQNIYDSEQFRKSFYQEIINNEIIDSSFLDINYSTLVQTMSLNGKFHEAFKLDSVINSNHNELKVKMDKDYSYKSSIDSIKTFIKIAKKLDETISDKDSLEFLKIIAQKRICNSVWFCHQGCGGCNYSLVTQKLEKFLIENKNYLLQDDAELEFITINHYYEESFVRKAKSYELFLIKHPNSSKKLQVLKELLYMYDYYEPDQKPFIKEKRNAVLQKIKTEFPDYIN